jgi:pimeloyl-ACP methyl ester carboxylesterase
MLTASAPRLSFARYGDTGPRVLLVMGLGMQGKVWQPQVDDLSRDHRVVTFDNRGIGKSDPLTGAPRVGDFARDALRVADEVGFSTFHLVGVSLGGMIAQELALLEPARVRSLTLIATHAGGPFGLAPEPRGLLAFARSFVGPREGRIRALQELLYPASFLETVDKAKLDARMKLQLGDRARPRTVLGQLFAVARHDTRKRLRELRAPTLILRPDLDILVRPTHSDLLASRIPNARLERVSEAGHGITFQSATLVSRLIREHVHANEPHEEAPLDVATVEPADADRAS